MYLPMSLRKGSIVMVPLGVTAPGLHLRPMDMNGKRGIVESVVTRKVSISNYKKNAYRQKKKKSIVNSKIKYHEPNNN